MYLSKDDIPQKAYPLTEVEQTMDFNSQSAAVPQTKLFFLSQQAPAVALAPLSLMMHNVPTIPVIPHIPPPCLLIHKPAP
jgi:hypothetical protein